MRIKINNLFYLLINLIFATNIYAIGSANFVQTKSKLVKLDSQIVKLRAALVTSESKLDLINKELAVNEKQLSQYIIKLKTIKQDIALKQKKISELENQTQELNAKIIAQQKLLAEHLVMVYKLGKDITPKIILSQDEPQALSRILTYHQYLLKSRQEMIATINTSQQQLKAKQKELQENINNQQNLQNQLSTQLTQFEKSKNYNIALVESLSKEISSDRLKMHEYQKDKQNLAAVLKNLVVSSSFFSKPFLSMQHNLPPPIPNPKTYKKMNQGITFFAGEGSPVYAVHAGKVVFSDWLNGYGLLIIIDHGQNFMTLYAHNQSLFLNKGSMVAKGEQIATVGHSGGIKQNGLYFEVRQGGKAVPPSEWLT